MGKQHKKGDPCPMCDGDGTIWNKDKTRKIICPWCKGSGEES